MKVELVPIEEVKSLVQFRSNVGHPELLDAILSLSPASQGIRIEVSNESEARKVRDACTRYFNAYSGLAEKRGGGYFAHPYYNESEGVVVFYISKARVERRAP